MTCSLLAAPGGGRGGGAPAPAVAAGGGGLVRSPSAIKQMLLEWTKQQTAGYEVGSSPSILSCFSLDR